MHAASTRFLACTLVAVLLAARTVTAATIPYGLQSDVSQATIDSWGWTEIHRSIGDSYQSEAAIVAAATGDYLMMGVYNPTTQLYEILGAGEAVAVTSITYNTYADDDNFNFNPNWSNGLNFYRTATSGSWGFTTIGATGLNSADVLLTNGFNDYTFYGQNKEDAELAKGLSFHTSGGYLTSGWAFNVTGNNAQGIYSYRERVFFTADASASVPEPTSLALWSVFGGLGMIATRRRGKLASVVPGT